MTEMIQGDFWAPFFCLYIPSQIDYYVQLTLGKVWWIVVCISSVAVTSSSSSRVNIGVPHNPYYWYVISISIRGLSRSSCHHPSLHSFLIYSLPFPAFLINSLPSVPFPSLLMLSLLISLKYITIHKVFILSRRIWRIRLRSVNSGKSDMLRVFGRILFPLTATVEMSQGA